MRNMIAIAQKELRSYFASPIAYLVIGFFALLYGYFYAVMVRYFISASMQGMMAGGQQAMNINQDLLRPVLQNATVLLLFVLPAMTMRTYAEERRSGTIELLLTSPLSDLQIIMGKFLGALTLYGVMLAVTLIHVGILFVYGNPEWKPIVTSYVGLLLLGIGGLGAAWNANFLTTTWAIASYVVLAIVLVGMWAAGAGFYYPLRQAIVGTPEAPPIGDEELFARLQNRRPEILAGIGIVGLLVLVAIMVYRPT